MKVSRERYQTGDISKVKRSYGFAWVFRFYATDESGKRKRVVQTFDSVKYPTERDVRLAVQGQLAAINAGTMAGKVSATFGTILDRYESECCSCLATERYLPGFRELRLRFAHNRLQCPNFLTARARRLRSRNQRRSWKSPANCQFHMLPCN